MKEQKPISPMGTARLRFEEGRPSAQPVEQLEPLLQHLCSAVRLFNLEEEVVWLAWELMKETNQLSKEERAALLLLVLVCLINLKQGSTRLPVVQQAGSAGLAELLDVLLADLPDGIISFPDSRAACDEIIRLLEQGRVPSLVGGAGDYKPLLFCPPHVYLQKMLLLEDRLVDTLARRLHQPLLPSAPLRIRGVGRDEADAALQAVLDRPTAHSGSPIRLTPEQQQAIVTAAQSSLTVISGGPGTGKTTVVVSILRVLRRLGVPVEQIALAAPTGKAANRMKTATQEGLRGIADPDVPDQELAELPEPRTLHRLLGYSATTDRFYHHENNRLAEAVVIVDEASMIDLYLMDHLARSLRGDARLILLGDAEQLPSVEAGAVLRDLLRATSASGNRLGLHGVLLTTSQRMDVSNPSGRNILTIAQRVRAGETDGLFDPPAVGKETIAVRTAAEELVFDKVELLETGDELARLDDFLKRWYHEQICGLANYHSLARQTYRYGPSGFAESDRANLERLFRHLERFRLVCLTRVYRTGSERINAELHARFLEDAEAGGDDYEPGEPILMHINDYGRQIFNGDQGLVAWVGQEGSRPRLMAVFPRAEGFAAFPLDSLRPNLTLAFAMTVHKSQGSEFEQVGLILPEKDLPINTREILYTAITRSKKSVSVAGARAIFESGVRKGIARHSGIAEKLALALSGSVPSPPSPRGEAAKGLAP
jgi:exodeoxyribonuclease V alpha subunit